MPPVQSNLSESAVSTDSDTDTPITASPISGLLQNAKVILGT